MSIIQSTPNLDAFKAKIEQAALNFRQSVQQELNTEAGQLCTNLSTASPVGSGDTNAAPQGDAPGPLNQSFTYEELQGSSAATMGVVIKTMQPTKLKYVTKGTGLFGPYQQRIYPLTAQALYWPGAAHPYRSIAGQKPNDFVTPVLTQGLQDLQYAASVALHDALGGL